MVSKIEFTPSQQRAIRTTGRSVIVSAAAGSGKTAVLSERCAYLVCDAPPGARCNADELLVLTFTEAAASEMRARIVGAIQQRAADDAGNVRLREQASLVDNAHITTIHAFCLWMIRRWFTEVGIDPSASVLDAGEAELLRRQVLDELFQNLYARAARADEPKLGHVEQFTEDGTPVQPRSEIDSDASLAERFVRLVDDYGLGDDGPIAEFVLRLSAFVTSLPDSDSWLQQAHENATKNPESVVNSLLSELGEEIAVQREHCQSILAQLGDLDPACAFYIELIQDYERQLGEWLNDLNAAVAVDAAEKVDDILKAIAAYDLSARGAPRLPKDTDPKIRADRDFASKSFKSLRENLFIKRLRTQFASLTLNEWLDGVPATTPYVKTLADLTAAFDDALTTRKRDLNVLEFADLETLAHRLLCDAANPEQPSEVARALQRRFAQVLVDEFQDVSPIQQAILHLVSRESDPAADDNLFVVGDVKQSIYRFRLAEPALFVRRLDSFRRGGAGEAIHLQENFRSKPEILDAVNLLFRALMRFGSGDVDYDESAELRPARADVAQAGPRRAVEFHILERTVTAKGNAPDVAHLESDQSELTDDGDDDSERPSAVAEQVLTDLNDPSKWDTIEREAHLIGRTILEWRRANAAVVEGRPPEFRDIAVLLRVARYNADRVSAMLNAMGLPAFAAVGGSLFGALEVRDVLSALSLLDNAQQDIPLASVMRSGVLGFRFNEDDLVALRVGLRRGDFHEAVRHYRTSSADVDLRRRLDSFLTRVEQFRDSVRREPLADVIRRMYDDHGYLAYACGLPNGARRRANLLKLYDLARSFGSFHKQGLHRFLQFIESLDREGQELSSAPPIGEAENVIRIMSVHQAKGLEFPVVFVAGLGTKFNLGDCNGRMIFGRQSHIGLRVVDPDRLIEYASAGHRLVATEIERAARAEEMRILYVAMTRARERLVLVGTGKHDSWDRQQSGARPIEPLTRHAVRSAQNALDWVLPVLSSKTDGSVGSMQGSGDGLPGPRDEPTYRIIVHAGEEIASWRLDVPDNASQRETMRAVGSGAPLPPHEPTAPNDEEVECVKNRIQFTYPHLSVTSVPATAAAGTFKGTFDFLTTAETAVTRFARTDSFAIPASRYAEPDDAGPIATGLLMHRVLQHLDFHATADGRGLNGELDRLVGQGIIKTRERARIDTDALGWFLNTPVAQSIREAGAEFRREFHFIAREPTESVFADATGDERDFVLVRGIVDGLWPVGDGLEIVDYKTDAVSEDDVERHAERYRPQMWLYARAMAGLWGKQTRRATLVYLSPRRLVSLTDPGRDPATTFQIGCASEREANKEVEIDVNLKGDRKA